MPDFNLPLILLDNAMRVEMTVGCRDCDLIPKVHDAGKVVSLGGKSVQIMHNGVRVVAGGYYGDWMTNIIERLQGHHEPQEEVIFQEILKHVSPHATMLELGGFWSYYSLWFKSQHGDLRQSYVVEPDPNHIAIGRANAALNHRDITFVQACVGGEPIKTLTFKTESAGDIQIPQISVPGFLRDHQISRLQILHCDTQGMETEIVRSCEPLFHNRTIQFNLLNSSSSHQRRSTDTSALPRHVAGFRGPHSRRARCSRKFQWRWLDRCLFRRRTARLDRTADQPQPLLNQSVPQPAIRPCRSSMIFGRNRQSPQKKRTSADVVAMDVPMSHCEHYHPR